MASRALDLMLLRCTDPKKIAFGKLLYEHGTVVANIAQSRIEIDQARLMVLSAALQIDLVRAKGAMKDIGMAKVRWGPFLFVGFERELGLMDSFGGAGSRT